MTPNLSYIQNIILIGITFTMYIIYKIQAEILSVDHSRVKFLMILKTRDSSHSCTLFVSVLYPRFPGRESGQHPGQGSGSQGHAVAHRQRPTQRGPARPRPCGRLP